MKAEKIVVHCSATPGDRDIDISDVRAWHLKRGFRDVGYHFFIKLDGTIQRGRRCDEQGAHVYGHNSDSIGICYAGGIGSNGKPKNTLTFRQELSLIEVVKSLQLVFGDLPVYGHRDLSPDKDGDGVVERHEWLKACPSFDVKTVLGGLCKR